MFVRVKSSIKVRDGLEPSFIGLQPTTLANYVIQPMFLVIFLFGLVFLKKVGYLSNGIVQLVRTLES